MIKIYSIFLILYLILISPFSLCMKSQTERSIHHKNLKRKVGILEKQPLLKSLQNETLDDPPELGLEKDPPVCKQMYYQQTMSPVDLAIQQKIYKKLKRTESNYLNERSAYKAHYYTRPRMQNQNRNQPLHPLLLLLPASEFVVCLLGLRVFRLYFLLK